MEARLSGEVAIVTGAGSGIGRATALRLSAEGAHTLVVDINEAGAKETVTLGGGHPGRLQMIGLDVSAEHAPEQIMSACIAKLGHPSVFVNNAGIGGARPTHETEDAELDRFLDVNFRSGFRICRAVLSDMVEGHRTGTIVHLSSIFALRGFPTSSVYSATKGALISLTQNQSADYGPYGIRVNAVAPGVIRTPMNAERLDNNAWFRDTLLEATPLGRVGAPEDIAAGIAFLCSYDASFITGQVLAIDGGWSTTKFAPMPV
ncbi:MAG: SDR family oxidoreductase [Gammaproteobacteria bacterium]|nr:SDR family oxidoreductase [Gammaproteobacteria bacterium]